MKKLFLTGLVAAAATVCLGAAAAPLPYTYTFTGSGIGPGGVPVSVASTFDFNNAAKTLTITLQNTSASNDGQDVPGSTLSGIFWKFTNNLNPVLTPVSATVLPGSILGACSISSGCAGVTDVGGEFGYAYQPLGLPGSADRGIASSGYLTTGVAGNLGNFANGAAGTNLDDPTSLDGINFGIISAATGYNPNGGLAAVPVIQDTVVFTLSYASDLALNRDLSILDIALVNYQYGTALSELNVPDAPFAITSVPEPSSLALLGLSLLGLGFIRRSADDMTPAQPTL